MTDDAYITCKWCGAGITRRKYWDVSSFHLVWRGDRVIDVLLCEDCTEAVIQALKSRRGL